MLIPKSQSLTKTFIRSLLLLALIGCFFDGISQDGIFRDTYFVNNLSVNFKNKDSVFVFKKGWTVTETIGGKTVTRTLTQDETDTVEVYQKENIGRWMASSVKYTDDDPGKLYLSPHWFVDSKDEEKYGSICYVEVPENGSVVLRKSYVKLSAITIPFAIRPALNDSTSSQVSTDLKLGASISQNFNWEIFKNKRLKARKSIYGASIGLGFGLGKVSLNQANTNVYYATREEVFEQNEEGLALFLAPGIGLNIKGFQVVLFRGYDFAITNNVRKWNYDGEGYWGVGLGVDLGTLAKF